MSYIDDFAAQYGLYLRADSPFPLWKIPMSCPTRLDQMQTEIADLRRKAEADAADLRIRADRLEQELRKERERDLNLTIAAELEKLAKALREGKAWLQSIERSHSGWDRCMKTEVDVQGPENSAKIVFRTR